MDVLGLNYQGSRLPNPQYANFHQSFPDKFLYGSETASTISSRGEYTFPVADGYGVVSGRGGGQDNANHQMSSYDLYFPLGNISRHGIRRPGPLPVRRRRVRLDRLRLPRRTDPLGRRQ